VDHEALKAFVEVARHNSFSAAAEFLQVSNTSVSYKIQKLEQSLNTQLFYRTTRAVSLTGLGQELLIMAKDLLSIAAEMKSLASEQMLDPQGKLRITATIALERLLGEWLIEFCSRYNNIEIELLSSNRHLDLHEHRLDFAFRHGPLPDSTLIARKLMDTAFGVFASPSLIEKHLTIKHPNDLKALPCLSSLAQGRSLSWPFKKGRYQYQINPSGALGFENMELILKSALAGIGVARLPLLMADPAVNTGDLIPLLEDWWPAAGGLYWVYPQRTHLTSKDRCFIEFILNKTLAIDKTVTTD